jgi:hypothetical protein
LIPEQLKRRNQPLFCFSTNQLTEFCKRVCHLTPKCLRGEINLSVDVFPSP